jgi:single-strand DNA-binding protein
MEIKGKLTANALVRKVDGGKLVTNFTIVMNEKDYTKNGKRKTITTYVKCNYWFNPGVAEFLNEGTLVELMGHMGAGSWVNKNGAAKANLTFKTSTIKILNISGKNGFQKTHN